MLLTYSLSISLFTFLTLTRCYAMSNIPTNITNVNNPKKSIYCNVQC